MFEFQVPEDLTECSEEDLQGCIAEAKREFGLLTDSDDVSDDTLDRMTDLADVIETLYREMQNRSVELAMYKRTASAKQIKKARFSKLMDTFPADPATQRNDIASKMEALVAPERAKDAAAISHDAE